MTSAKIFRDGQISKEDFIAAQESCGKIQQAIERNRPKTIIVDGIRCVRAPKQNEMNRIVKYKPIIPISILVQYSMSLHFSYHTFHQSPPAILRKIKRHFYVLEDSAVRNTIGGCYLCQTSSPITDVRQTYSKHILPPKPRLHMAFDICGGVNEDSSNFKYIFLCIDIFSNYVIAAPAKSRSAREIINFLRLAVLNYSLIHKLTFDGELSLLQNKESNDFLTFYNIEKHRTAFRNPEANGVIERQMANVKKSVRILTTCHGNWSKYLPYLITSINNTTQTFLASPAEVTYGEELLPKGNLLELEQDYANTKEYFDRLKPHVENIRAQFKKRKEQRIKSNLLYINKKRTKKNLLTGDLVILQNLHLTKGMGMRAIGSPGIILEICKSGKSALVQNLLTQRIVKYNLSFLRRVTKPLFAKLPDDWKEQIVGTTRKEPRDSSSSESQFGNSQEDLSQPLDETQTEASASQGEGSQETN